MHMSTSSPRQNELPRATQEQRETAELESRRTRLQNQLDRWRQERAKDEKVYQDMIRSGVTNALGGQGRESYREMHVQCDRVWAERIQLKKAELAALVLGGLNG
jgi:hypothetical protein